jgi:hypothetical protein
MFTFVIATLQMTQALNLAKSKIEIIFYVCLHPTPNMIAVFPVHSLHLAKMDFQVLNWRKFKKTSPSNLIK